MSREQRAAAKYAHIISPRLLLLFDWLNSPLEIDSAVQAEKEILQAEKKALQGDKEILEAWKEDMFLSHAKARVKLDALQAVQNRKAAPGVEEQ